MARQKMQPMPFGVYNETDMREAVSAQESVAGE